MRSPTQGSYSPRVLAVAWVTVALTTQGGGIGLKRSTVVQAFSTPHHVTSFVGQGSVPASPTMPASTFGDRIVAGRMQLDEQQRSRRSSRSHGVTQMDMINSAMQQKLAPAESRLWESRQGGYPLLSGSPAGVACERGRRRRALRPLFAEDQGWLDALKGLEIENGLPELSPGPRKVSSCRILFSCSVLQVEHRRFKKHSSDM